MHRRTLLHSIGWGGLAMGLSAFQMPESLSAEKQEQVYRLLYNENPDGPSKQVQKMMRQNLGRGNRYCTFHQYDFMALKQAIALEEGLKPENVLLGHGSFEPLTQVAIHFGTGGGEIITPSPSFDVVGAIARQVGGKVKSIEVDANFDIDLERMEGSISSNTQLLTLCNPNNPTGKQIPRDKLVDFCNTVQNRLPVLIDEAYIQYLPDWKRQNMSSLIGEGKQILITRTFSKIYAMAGLRIGYLLGPASIIQTLEKKFTMGFPGNMPNVVSVAAAIAALQDKSFLESSRQNNQERRSALYEVLKSQNIEYLASTTNFVYFDVVNFPAFKKHMNENGVILAGGWPSKPNWGRVTLGTKRELDHFYDLLEGKPWLA